MSCPAPTDLDSLVHRYTSLSHRGRQQFIENLDPYKDYWQISHLIAGYEFPWDTNRALEVALLRTFCSPRVSKLLDHTGEFRHRGQKRYDDTSLLLIECVKAGLGNPRGLAAVERVNAIHGRFSIRNEDYLYVLSTFVTEPIRWIDLYGHRPTTEHERVALFLFFRDLGTRMQIRQMPSSYAELFGFAAEYETRHFRPAPSNRRVADAAIDVMRAWWPSLLRPSRRRAWAVLSAVIDAPMREALGCPDPGALTWGLVRQTLRTRARALRAAPPNKKSGFYVDSRIRSYPDGYTIEELGPK